jgi:hypothetical protein
MNDRTMLLPLVDAPFPELKQSLRTNLIGFFMLGGHTIAVIANGPDAVWLEIAVSSREQWMPLGTVTKINDDQPRVTLPPVYDRSGRRVLVPCPTTDADLLARVRHVLAGGGR